MSTPCPTINLFVLDAPRDGGAASAIAHWFEALKVTNHRPRLLFLPPPEKATGSRPSLLGVNGREISDGEALELAHGPNLNIILAISPKHPSLPDLSPLSMLVLRSEADLAAITAAGKLRAAFPAVCTSPLLHAKVLSLGLPAVYLPLPFSAPRATSEAQRNHHAIGLSRLSAKNNIGDIILANESVRPHQRCLVFGSAGDAVHQIMADNPRFPTFYRGPMPATSRASGISAARQAALVVYSNRNPGGMRYAMLEAIAAGAVLVAPSTALSQAGIIAGEEAFSYETPADLAAILAAPVGNRTRMGNAAHRHLAAHSPRTFAAAFHALLETSAAHRR